MDIDKHYGMDTEMKICIFGGTFDPPHICHTLACLYVLETTDVDRIIVIPCYRHPLGKNATSFKRRVAMCRLALECLAPHVEVSEMESQRDGPSYTIDTLKLLKEEHPQARLSLLIGSDLLKETHLWKSFDEIQNMARVIVLPRPEPGGKKGGEAKGESFPFMFPDISSTEIRRRIGENEDASPFLSRKVMDYIRKHNLYHE